MREKVEAMFPGKFEFEPLRDSYDYIYLTENLINLPGKKFHGKRNHIAAFVRDNEWSYEPITADNLDECIAMNAEWERRNREKDPEAMDDELDAINISFKNYFELGFVGGLLRANGEVVAFTFGEEMNPEMFCTHIEKAYADVRGAYPMINREFAANALSQYKYVNREDDTGSEGLRKAKLSYYPDILLENIWQGSRNDSISFYKRGYRRTYCPVAHLLRRRRGVYLRVYARSFCAGAYACRARGRQNLLGALSA